MQSWDYYASSKVSEKIEDEISNVVADLNRKKLEDLLCKVELSDGSFSQTKFWELKRKIFSQSDSAPIAMKDKEGNNITSEAALKKLYRDTYYERLKPAKMDRDLNEISQLKESLWKMRKRIWRKM